MKKRALGILLITIFFFLASCGPLDELPSNGPTSVGNNSTGGSGIQPSDWGTQKKTSGCIINGKFPDKDCTPGAIISSATKSAVCKSGYSKTVRNVPESEKKQVYAEYGIASRSPGQYEVDHFISLELGGSNDISNLFPEPASPTPGFHEKDKVENYLHAQVCSGAITLLEAQTEISGNWVDVYNSMPK